MRMGILFTNRCNAACAHCSTSCGPTQRDRLSLDEIKSVIEQCAALSEGEDKQVCISGGEPFLYWKELVEMVRYGGERGVRMTCVTNAFWATSFERATTKLARLQRLGLIAVAYSTSEYHHEYVPLERVRLAIQAAKALGLVVILKFPYTRSGLQPSRLEEMLGGDVVDGVVKAYFSVMPTLREGTEIPLGEMLLKDGLPSGTCPMPIVTVRETGNAYTCCIPGGFTDALKLGNVKEQPLHEIRAAFEYGALQLVLTREGPSYLARALVATGLGDELRAGYIDVCDLCTHMMSKPNVAAACAEIADEYQARAWTEALEQQVHALSGSAVAG